MRKFTTRDLTLAAVLAAVYAALTITLPVPQYGAVQIRFAEALTVLPFLFPAATPGLFVGCIIANLFSPFVLDVVFGSMATLLACLWTSRDDQPMAGTPAPRAVQRSDRGGGDRLGGGRHHSRVLDGIRLQRGDGGAG